MDGQQMKSVPYVCTALLLRMGSNYYDWRSLCLYVGLSVRVHISKTHHETFQRNGKYVGGMHVHKSQLTQTNPHDAPRHAQVWIKLSRTLSVINRRRSSVDCWQHLPTFTVANCCPQQIDYRRLFMTLGDGKRTYRQELGVKS